MSYLLDHVAALCVSVLNAVIAALAAAVNAVLSLFPAMPSTPTLPTQFTSVMGWINWFFPVGTLVSIIAFLVTAWLLWMALATVLRWAKVVE
jgi:hypothetical protein